MEILALHSAHPPGFLCRLSVETAGEETQVCKHAWAEAVCVCVCVCVSVCVSVCV